jgi:DHA2 family multidrug resistance protein
MQIRVQASVITYSETFYVLAVALAACIPLALLLKTPARSAGGQSGSGH